MSLRRTIFLALLAALYGVTVASGCDGLTGEGGSGEAEIVWTLPKSNPYDNLVQPVVEDDRAYVAADARVFAVDAETGEELWSRGPLPIAGSISSRKLLADGGVDGTLYLNEVGWVKAFGKRDGRERWTAILGDFRPTNLTKMAEDQANLYLGGRGAAQQVRKSDGALGHRFEVGAFAPEGVTELVYDVGVSDGLLVAPVGWSADGDSVAIRGAVYAFDTSTGAERWRFEVPLRKELLPGRTDSIYTDVDASGAAFAGDRVIVTTTTQVLALDRATGALLWEQFMPKGGGFWVGPTVANGAVYAGGVTERVYKLDAETGEVLWTHRMKGSLQPNIVVRDGRVHFTNNGWGELWVLDDAMGRPLWHGRPPDYEETGALYLSPVAVGEDRMVVVGNQHVYGLTRP